MKILSIFTIPLVLSLLLPLAHCATAEQGVSEQETDQTALLFLDVLPTSGIDFRHYGRRERWCSIGPSQVGYATNEHLTQVLFEDPQEFAEEHLIRMNGSGMGWIDYDKDGNWDLYLVNGQGGPTIANKLFRNEGNGSFADVTIEAGVGDLGEGMGVVIGDYNNDGYGDIFITNFGPNVLLRNNRNGTFTDVTNKAFPDDGGDLWSTSAAWADYDHDGWLDLYIANYVELSSRPPTFDFRFPMQFRGQPNVLYRNRGDGSFEDATGKAGVVDANQKSMGVLFADVNADGWADLYISNDTDANSLYLNNGDGTFTNFSGPSGTSSMAGSMGIAYGDYDNDLRMDLYITNYTAEANLLYRQLDSTLFSEDFRNWKLQELSWPYVGWGTGLFDFDLDGDLDLFVANGHLNSVTGDNRMDNLLCENRGGIFTDVSEAAGIRGPGKRIYRSVAFADFDNDGHIDFYVANNGENAAPLTAEGGVGVLMRNMSNTKHHWLKVRLQGTVSNRNGFGARVFCVLDGRTQVQELYSGGTYMASNAPELVFGLGSSETVDELRIDWPSGIRQTLRNVKSDQTLLVVEKE